MISSIQVLCHINRLGFPLSTQSLALSDGQESMEIEESWCRIL